MTIASGGVLPHIMPELLKKKDGNKFQMPGNNKPLAIKDKSAIQKAKNKVTPKKSTAKSVAAKAAMSKAKQPTKGKESSPAKSPAKKVR